MADQGIPTLVDGPQDAPDAKLSHRLIVELDSPPLAVAYRDRVGAAGVNGRLNVNAPDAQTYIAQLQAEQAAFVADMGSVLQDASVSTFINELGVAEQASYQIVFNGLAVDPGSADREEAKQKLARMPGVKAVYYDRAYETQLYTSTTLIGATTVWAEAGGAANAGTGVKVASMDGGLHKDAAMFDGTGWSYPAGYPADGLGLTANNNGKIIASRVYFRSWDPPAPGDENPWPGVAGTSHGTHTGSTAAGNCVDNVEYLGYNVGTMCGVAPGAWLMSYRVFYASVNGNESFYTAEGVAALEDIVADGADVLNNSWGEGPISEGGQFDPIDQALINAANAGIFVSMSNGNSGPNLGTSDHPSDDYINVAASTTSGTLAAGQVGISGPGDVGAEYKDFPFGTAEFGDPLPVGTIETYNFKTAAAVQPENTTGCSAFPAGAFDGVAAVISRGDCFFTDKVYNAQQAGATFAVIYNNAGDGLINMACGGDFCADTTIPSIFIGQTNGNLMVDWYAANGDASTMEFNSIAFQAGNTPDVIIDFSSRGPAVGNVLKPDITAPGVNILAQGYGAGTGEARHLGYGQASGTSMAAPHVAGAAALLRQIHPDWSNAAIKSAMMSTSKYMGIYTQEGIPAQPLDMGAGRLDVAAAVDPGVILDPPSLSFGVVPTGTQKTIDVTVTSVADAAETYSLSTFYAGENFTDTTAMAGVTADVASVTLNPGESKVVKVTFDAATGMGMGDNQGFVVMQGDNGHAAHMPAWARVTFATNLADVLIIDADASYTLGNYDYLWYYTSTLDQLGYSYEVVDADANYGYASTIPDATTLMAFKAIVVFTGEAYQPDGTFTVSTPLTQADQDRLVEYLNSGGSLIAMGQDLASLLNAAEFDAPVGNRNFLYSYRLGANYVQDSVSNGDQPQAMIIASATAPAALRGAMIDLTKPRKYETNPFAGLSGAEEVPAVETDTIGAQFVAYDVDQNDMFVRVTVVPTPTVPIEVIGAHIHAGAAGVNGDVVRSLEPEPGFFPTVVTDTLTVEISITDLVTDEIDALIAGNLYINVHTTEHPDGEVRGQILLDPYVVQGYVDEIDNVFHDGSQDPNPDGTTSESNLGSNLIFQYQGSNNVFSGAVAAALRDQVSLERAGTDYSGRSVYTTFGLEGMDEGPGSTTRAQLLGALLAWSWAESSPVVIANTTAPNGSGLVTLSASLGEGVNAAGQAQAGAAVSYRWDFGDGTPFVTSASDTVGHTYACNAATGNIYTARVEIVDDLGIVSLGSLQVDVSESCQTPTALDRDPEPLPGNATKVFLPFVEK
ncbi:MAG: S8 family serine peptidase [Caldilineaceae bacterium]|nr:S8 family serine peptidase [Caldilineaceae bacterium]